MKILDFLFYYLVRWFNLVDRRKIKTVSYPDQVSYALAICFVFWLMTMDGLTEFIIFHSFSPKIPVYVFVVIALLFYVLLRYVYIKKKRYNLILDKTQPIFNVSDKTGITIAIITFFSGILTFMAVAIIIHSI